MIFHFSRFQIDTLKFEIFDSEQHVAIEPQTFDVIIYLITHRERVVSRQEIFDKVWPGKIVSDTSLSNQIKSARQALGDNGQAQQIIKTIHGRGYQFVANVTEETSTTNDPSSLSEPAKNEVKLNRLKLKMWAPITILLLVVIIFSWREFATPQQNNQHSIHFDQPMLMAVLPFINSKPHIDTDYFSFAIADQIIGNLAYLSGFSVRPSSSVKKYSNENYDPVAVGQSMKVDYVLTGNFLNVDKLIRLNVELINVSTGKLIWRSEQIESNYDNIFQLQDRVAQKISQGLQLEISQADTDRLALDNPSSALAYDLYLRSIALPFSTAGHEQAIKLLKRVVTLDENFAPAYVQLGSRIRRYEQFGLKNSGESHGTVEYYQKALAINGELMEALSALAFVYTETNRIDEAVLLAKKMLDINPKNASAHFTMGYIYRYAGMNQEAIREMLFATNIDPTNIRFRSLVATYSGNAKYAEALKLLDNYDEGTFTKGWNGILNYNMGNNKLAVDFFDELIEQDPDGLWGLVATVHRAGILDRKEEGLYAIHQLEQTNITDGETVFYTAAYYGMFKDRVRCLQTLRKAIEGGYFNTTIIKLNRHFQFLIDDPEFKELIELANSKHQRFKKRLSDI